MSRDKRLNIRLTEEEYRTLNTYAKGKGQTASDVVRAFIATLTLEARLEEAHKVSDQQTEMVIELCRMGQALGVKPSEWLKGEAEKRGLSLEFEMEEKN